MNMRDRFAFFVMPFKWARRGCFDWEGARVAWFYAFVGRPSRKWGKDRS